MEVIAAIHARRSIRSYLSRSVERDVIEAVIWDAAQAPPSHSGQVPWTFNVVQGVGRIAGYGDQAKQYARENHPVGPGWEWTEKPDFEVFWGAPALIIISGGVEDCCRAGANLMLSAYARGLGTCWVGSPLLWLRTSAAKAELHIPVNLTPAAAFCLGYPKIVPEAQLRKQPQIIWVR
jgi:nitroreductase